MQIDTAHSQSTITTLSQLFTQFDKSYSNSDLRMHMRMMFETLGPQRIDIDAVLKDRVQSLLEDTVFHQDSLLGSRLIFVDEPVDHLKVLLPLNHPQSPKTFSVLYKREVFLRIVKALLIVNGQDTFDLFDGFDQEEKLADNKEASSHLTAIFLQAIMAIFSNYGKISQDIGKMYAAAPIPFAQGLWSCFGIVRRLDEQKLDNILSYLNVIYQQTGHGTIAEKLNQIKIITQSDYHGNWASKVDQSLQILRDVSLALSKDMGEFRYTDVKQCQQSPWIASILSTLYIHLNGPTESVDELLAAIPCGFVLHNSYGIHSQNSSGDRSDDQSSDPSTVLSLSINRGSLYQLRQVLSQRSLDYGYFQVSYGWRPMGIDRTTKKFYHTDQELPFHAGNGSALLYKDFSQDQVNRLMGHCANFSHQNEHSILSFIEVKLSTALLLVIPHFNPSANADAINSFVNDMVSVFSQIK